MNPRYIPQGGTIYRGSIGAGQVQYVAPNGRVFTYTGVGSTYNDGSGPGGNYTSDQLGQQFPGGTFQGTPGSSLAGLGYALGDGTPGTSAWYWPPGVSGPVQTVGQAVGQGVTLAAYGPQVATQYGTPVMATPWNQAGGYAQGGRSMNLTAYLAAQPVLTAYATGSAKALSDVMAAASVADFDSASEALAFETSMFLGQQSQTSNTSLYESLFSNGAGQSIIGLLQAVGLAPAVATMITANQTFDGAIAAAVTADVGGIWANYLLAWAAFANAAAGPLSTGATGTNSLAFALLLSQGQGNGLGLSQNQLLALLVNGPAFSTFAAFCTTAAQACGAATTYTATITALAGFPAAFAAFVSAVQSQLLFTALLS